MKIQPTLPADKLLNHLIKTTHCLQCSKDYDRGFPDCPYCEHIYSESIPEEALLEEDNL